MNLSRCVILLLALLALTASPRAATADFLTAVGHFSTGIGAISTTVPVTISPAFQPKCLLFFFSVRTETTNTVAGGHTSFGVGFATSTTARASMVVWSQDNTVTAAGRALRRSDAAVAIPTSGGIDALLDFSSFDASGFTLVVDDVASASFTVDYIALGGSDITNCTVGSFLPGTGAGNFAVTGVGFQPDTVWLIDAAANTTVDPLNQGLALMSLGVAAGSPTPTNAVVGIGHISGGGSDTKRYGLEGESWVNWTTTGTITGRASVTAWTSDGFTFNKIEAGVASRVFYLAIKGGQYKVGKSLTQTNTSTDIVTTGYGFTPQIVAVGSHNTTESTADTPQDHAELSFGAATSTTVSRVMAYLDEDGLTTTETAYALEFGASIAPVLLNISTADAIEGRMKIQSFDSNGVTFRMDDADPAQSFFWYWAAGPTAVAAGAAKGGMLMRGVGP